MTAGSRPWLVVVDPQVIFSSPDSAWGSPMFAGIVPHLTGLAEAFDGRVVVTRFVADAHPRGSWVPYYAEWPFARVPEDDPLYALDPSVATIARRAPVVTSATFGKWGPALREIVGMTPELVLAGVSTDCCVIATALAAADDGATVTIATDGCAGSTPENHTAAVHVMGLFAPQITLATTEEILARC